MQLFVLAAAANSCKMLREHSLLSPWLSSFPDTLALVTQMSSTFTEGKGGGKRVERRAMFTSSYQLSTLLMLPLRYMNAHECISAYAPAVWPSMWEHPYTFPFTFSYTLLQTEPEGTTDLSVLSVLLPDMCWKTTLNLEFTTE